MRIIYRRHASLIGLKLINTKIAASSQYERWNDVLMHIRYAIWNVYLARDGISLFASSGKEIRHYPRIPILPARISVNLAGKSAKKHGICRRQLEGSQVVTHLTFKVFMRASHENPLLLLGSDYLI